MQIIKHRKIYFAISALLVAASLVAIAALGLRLGIDFTGGSLLEISVDERAAADVQAVEQSLITPSEGSTSGVLDSVQVQRSGENGFVLRFKNVDEEGHQSVLAAINAALLKTLSEQDREALDAESPQSGIGASSIQALDADGNPVDIQIEPVGGESDASAFEASGPAVITEERFESIGPVIGEELKQKSAYAIFAVIIAIVLYIAWAFRKVSDPVSSWKYGVTAIIALLHDVSIPAGVFAVLGAVAGIEVDILFVTALLTTLGYSVNDTIVVFDRTRENLARDHHRHDFEWIVNKSVNETIRRSVYTAATTFVVLLAVYLYGGESIKNFVLALMIGVVAGTYSSIFLASPLLVAWEKRSRE